MSVTVSKETLLDSARIAFNTLLQQFRQGFHHTRDHEIAVLDNILEVLTSHWDQRFPGFPPASVANASLKGVIRRGVRDTYLKSLIQSTLSETQCPGGKVIVNPVCVFGRHARDIAEVLPEYQVLATDIFSGCNWMYEHLWRRRTPKNYRFVKDNIFAPQVDTQPIAVVFFGACGSLTDAALDHAIRRQAPFILCRTCCHDNIAGNTRIVKRPNTLNWAFRWKNVNYRLAQCFLSGHYFSPAYGPEHYPTSATVRALSTAEEFLTLSQNSVDSDICRTLIDLDRYLYLTEQGYRVFYRGELFVAQRFDS